MVEYVRDAEVLRFDRLEDANRALAERLAEVAGEAVRTRGRFALALAGGSTPQGLYECLAANYQKRIPWDRTHLFWGDERWVPTTDQASNYRMAHDTLISRIPVPAVNVHPMPVDIGPPAEVALAYEKILRKFFESSDRDTPEKTFDVFLLGVGADGHTASLFPEDPVLEERTRWVRSVTAPAAMTPRKRITLTLPPIIVSRYAFVLAAGPEKAGVVDLLLRNPDEARRRFPAARVRTRAGSTWFVAAKG
jgi:6-phosphogluconolactonase